MWYSLSPTKNSHKREVPHMKNTTEAYFRQRLIEYAKKHGVTKAADRYHLSRKTVYKWMGRYDGTVSSLNDQSHRPHHSPRAHTEEEILAIVRRLRRHGWKDLILVYQELVEKAGYTRSYGGFKRVAEWLRKGKVEEKKRQKRKNKPYAAAEFPGQKVQIDVKYVPRECAADGKQYYEFIAVDEYSRWTFRYMYEERSTYSARDFLIRFLNAFPYKVYRVQTDNGSEFTKQLWNDDKTDLTLFEQELRDRGIVYQRIRPATPRHNGKVERQNRIDGERFYSKLRMYSLEDGRKQLAVYQRKSNTYWKHCLGLRSPNQVLALYDAAHPEARIR